MAGSSFSGKVAGARRALGDYSAIVKKQETDVWAEDEYGKTIAEGEAGVDDDVVINKVATQIKEGIIHLSKGEFIINSKIILDRSSLIFIGEGMYATILKFLGTDDEVFYIDSSSSFVNGVKIIDICIDANNKTAIHIKSGEYTSSNGYYSNIKIKNVSKGIYLEGYNCINNYFENILIESVSEYGIYNINGIYNTFNDICITYVLDNAFSVYNYGLQNKYNNISTDGVVQDAGQNTVWDLLTVERIYATTPPSRAAVYFNGLNIQANTITLINIDPNKCEYGLALAANYYTIINLRQLGTLYPDYLLVPNTGGGTKGLIVNVQGNSKYWGHLSDGRSKEIKYISKGLSANGISQFSGDGITKQFKIEHKLYTTPDLSKTKVFPLSADAATNFYLAADNTYLYINYLTAPPSGTNNVVLGWEAEV